MGDNTGIEWTDATWNPVTGCTKVSPGCDNCYAESIAHRFAGTKSYPNGFDVTMHPERLAQPLRWRKPRRVFVNSMSDLFHKDVTDDYIARVFSVMALTPRHTFQVLTKRPARMRMLLSRRDFQELMADNMQPTEPNPDQAHDWLRYHAPAALPNVWLGVSTENQKWADIRIPELINTPAAVRFISAEPLLGPIDLIASGHIGGQRGHGGMHPGDGSPDCPRELHHHHDARCKPSLDWVIAGGESGRGARPMHPVWARSLRDQCAYAEVAFLFKQWGEWEPLGDRAARDGDAVVLSDPFNPYNRTDENDRPEAWTPWNRDIHGRCDGSMGRAVLRRVGKKAAGRELDGRTWDASPPRCES